MTQPTNEMRLRRLADYQVINTEPEQIFRNIALLAKQIFRSRLAIISFVGEDYVFYKEVVGGDFAGVKMPSTESPCAFAVYESDVTVLNSYPHPSSPAWNSYHFMVHNHGLRFYAAAPIRSPDGFPLGVIAVVDEAARKFHEDEKNMLRSLSRIVVDELELRLSTLKEVTNYRDAVKSLAEKNQEIVSNLDIIHESNAVINVLNEELKSANEELRASNAFLNASLGERNTRLFKSYKALIETKKELSALLYHASHGLRGPITSSLGIIDLLRLEHQEVGQMALVNKLETAQLKLLNSLQKLSKVKELIDSSLHTLPSIFSDGIRSVFDGVLAKYKPQLDAKGFIVNMEIATDVSLRCTEEYLALIVGNLVENSMNFARADPGNIPTIRIHVLDTDVGSCLITWSDNGEGIPRESLPHVFDMFYRASDRAGSGLGLFLVKRVVDRLKGTIEVASIHHQMTQFYIQIPN